VTDSVLARIGVDDEVEDARTRVVDHVAVDVAALVAPVSAGGPWDAGGGRGGIDLHGPVIALGECRVGSIRQRVFKRVNVLDELVVLVDHLDRDAKSDARGDAGKVKAKTKRARQHPARAEPVKR